MNRRSIAALFFAVAVASVLVAPPAAAFEYKHHCGAYGGVKWWSNLFSINVPRNKFNTQAWVDSLEAARSGWNTHAPGSYWAITYKWVDSAPGTLLDGKNDLTIAEPQYWQYGGWASVTKHLWGCSPAVFSEVDTTLNPDSVNWDKSTNPVPSDYMQNTTLVLLHEHGHIMGLGHENDVLATMNDGFPGPVGGPIGNNNEVHPLGDDARGARNAYGTKATVRDVAASAVRLVSPGVSRTIPAPSSAFRNSIVSFAFTILNRGTTDETIPVYFYLSPTRYAHPSTSFYLGSTTISLLYARMTTGSVNVLIPANAPTGYQYIGWYTDPNNGIGESNEGNNGVSLVSPTYISPNGVPTACFTATPTSGYVPLTVSLNAGCSTDPDGNPLTYTWDFGDGMTDSGATVSHTFYYQGYHTVTLTVTDSSGASSSTYRYISVACQDSRFCPEEPY